MKVAVASSDGINISDHFGRSACFIIFDIENGKISNREVRDNRYTPHAKGECTGDEGEHEHHHHGTHSHSAIVQALHDCEAVLCYGMGMRAARDLEQAGVKAFIIETRLTPEAAVGAFLEGRLQQGVGFCKCHEHEKGGMKSA